MPGAYACCEHQPFHGPHTPRHQLFHCPHWVWHQLFQGPHSFWHQLFQSPHFGMHQLFHGPQPCAEADVEQSAPASRKPARASVAT